MPFFSPISPLFLKETEEKEDLLHEIRMIVSSLNEQQPTSFPPFHYYFTLACWIARVLINMLN